ncbi:MAG TPA: hypothetical protein VKE26_25430 [Xanthobacteraceae bacterium]|nr:hypothetical protein [Xanthobacteraceae bacterium]
MPSPSQNLAARHAAASVGPPAAFVTALLIAFAPLALSRLVLPHDLALPLASTLLLVLAAPIALVGWKRGRPAGRDSITYLDVAGALTFIGIFAATLMDPDQMMRIVDAQRED